MLKERPGADRFSDPAVSHSMGKIVFLVCLLCILFPPTLFSQETGNERVQPGGTEQKKQEGKEAPGTADDKKAKKGRNVNVDAMALYGQYNRILWSGSITQSFDPFTYQLNSNFRRSNDFGYKNSRYYENEIGFTGVADATEKWKITPEVEVKNDSHGMFRNPFYTREEKDKVILKLKNEYTPMPTRWSLNLGGIYFIHRLDSSLYPDVLTARPYHSSDFYKGSAEVGWQYIWSAANKLSFNSKFSHYDYSTRADNDTWVSNEFIWNFNISEFLKVGLGPLYAYNRDRGHFISGKIDAATLNIKYFSANASYLYELVPFAPEDYYFNQRYAKPDYSLMPGKGHHADCNAGIDISNTGNDPFYVKRVKVKAAGSFVTNDRFYSFFSLPEQVLEPYRMKVKQARARGEASVGFMIYSAYLELGGKYEYTYSYASSHVTYQPRHTGGGYLRVTVWRFEAEFNNAYRSRIDASPFISTTIGPALTGSLSLQFRVLDSFYLYGRVDNIYNSKRSTVYGYPEQGRTVIGGLRIVI
jgi:hypothetical protein